MHLLNLTDWSSGQSKSTAQVFPQPGNDDTECRGNSGELRLTGMR